MKPKPMFLNELNASSKDYKVRVRVIEKNRPQLGQLRKLPYQGLLMLDDKGNKMRGALFGAQIKNFQDAIVYNGTYEIANAPIKPMEDKWKKTQDELNYQMFFGRDTIIQRLNTDSGPVQPSYKSIGQIPRAGDPTDMFDVLGIVLYVDRKPREATIGPQRKIGVTEIVLMNHSTEQPLSISAWDDLAAIASQTLVAKTEGFPVVALTALKVSRHRGFSMTTTKSSEIIQEPDSPKVVALQAWSTANIGKLTELRTCLIQAKAADKQKLVITIATLQAKRAQHTLQDERHWLKVTVPSAEFKYLNAYLGCSKCGRRSDMPVEAIYTCPLCNREGCTSTPRVTFNCEVTDGTGDLSITAFTNHAEKLFRLSAQDLFRIKHSEDLHAFEAAQVLLRETPYLIQVGPSNTLSISNILEWTLRQVVTERDGSADSSNLSDTAQLQQKTDGAPDTPIIDGPEHLKTPEKKEDRVQKKTAPAATSPPVAIHEPGVKVNATVSAEISETAIDKSAGELEQANLQVDPKSDGKTGFSTDVGN